MNPHNLYLAERFPPSWMMPRLYPLQIGCEYPLDMVERVMESIREALVEMGVEFPDVPEDS